MKKRNAPAALYTRRSQNAARKTDTNLERKCLVVMDKHGRCRNESWCGILGCTTKYSKNVKIGHLSLRIQHPPTARGTNKKRCSESNNSGQGGRVVARCRAATSPPTVQRPHEVQIHQDEVESACAIAKLVASQISRHEFECSFGCARARRSRFRCQSTIGTVSRHTWSTEVGGRWMARMTKHKMKVLGHAQISRHEFF